MILQAFSRPLSGLVLSGLMLSHLTGCSPASLEPNLSSIQDHILSPRCATAECHAGPRPEFFLDLSPGRSYQNLVGEKSRQVPDRLLVAPGKPAESYLIQKLEGTDIVGDRMPSAEESLSSREIEVIREWVARGAPREAL